MGRTPAANDVPLRLLCLGQSHFGCVSRAADAGHEALARAGVEITTLVMNQPQFDPHFEPGAGLHPALRDEALRLSATADAVYLSIGGTAHCVFGLMEHEQPFDFVLEPEPTLPLLPGREAVAGGLIRGALESTSLFRHQRALRRFLPGVLRRPLALLESPPPLFDDARLLANLGGYRRLLTERGIAPAPVRRKLWRLHSFLVAEDCAAAGIEFVAAPSAAQDTQGYLAPQALADDDPTHANTWYGRRLIEQMVRRHRADFAFDA